jgi:hypothetical protein
MIVIQHKIEDLKPGFKVFEAHLTHTNYYEYLCPYPYKNPKNDGGHFIFIDMGTGEPIRMYKTRVQQLLDGGLFTLNDAFDKQFKMLEERVRFLTEIRSKRQDK